MCNVTQSSECVNSTKKLGQETCDKCLSTVGLLFLILVHIFLMNKTCNFLHRGNTVKITGFTDSPSNYKHTVNFKKTTLQHLLCECAKSQPCNNMQDLKRANTYVFALIRLHG